jgi:gamma-glutamylcyclotransferase (GGCT)/AIG2-like uncharacterized protein YtfP
MRQGGSQKIHNRGFDHLHCIMPEPDLSPTHERLFFVYGTLRRGDDNDITRLEPAPRLMGHARIKGVMHHLGGYPGVTLGGDGDIVGEVYAVSAALEAKLDAIESEYPAQPDEYAKRDITVLVNGQALACSVYEINPSYTLGKPVIPSGDWVKDR